MSSFHCMIKVPKKKVKTLKTNTIRLGLLYGPCGYDNFAREYVPYLTCAGEKIMMKYCSFELQQPPWSEGRNREKEKRFNLHAFPPNWEAFWCCVICYVYWYHILSGSDLRVKTKTKKINKKLKKVQNHEIQSQKG